MGGSFSQTGTVGKPVVVVVGAGYAGVTVARLLDRDFFVVVIDRKDHFTHVTGLARALVDAQAADAMHVTYERLLTNGVFVRAHVASISATEVRLEGFATPLTGFSYLILATGSSYSLPARVGPVQRAAKLALFGPALSALTAAQRVLVIGGGPVGTETAAEIATDFPAKQVTLVSAAAHLGSPGLDDRFYAAAEQGIRALRVTVIKSARVTIPDDVSAALSGADLLYLAQKRRWALSDGQQVEADLAFFAVGSALNTGALAALSGAQTTTGDLRVNGHMQVEGYSHVFAIGDISARDPRKLAFIASEQAKWLGANLLAIHRAGGDVSALKPWKGLPPAQLLSLGRKAGAGVFNDLHFPSWMVAFLKSKDMMTQKTRESIGAKKSDGLVVATEEQKRQRATRLSAALKLSDADAKRLVAGLDAAAQHPPSHL